MFFHVRYIACVIGVSMVALAGVTSCGVSCVAEEVQGRPLKALLVLGGCCHDYKTQAKLLKEGIESRANVQVKIAYDPDTSTGHLNPVYESPDWADGFDVVIHDECSSDVKDLALVNRILGPHQSGVPAVILHCGMHSYRTEGYPNVTPWFEFTGLQTTGHGPQVPIEIEWSDVGHPIVAPMKGIDWTTANEELYNNSAGKLLPTAKLLARGSQSIKKRDGSLRVDDCVVVWTNRYRESTKVFATTLGHNNATVADSRYLDLVTRGLLWSCDRLADDDLK